MKNLIVILSLLFLTGCGHIVTSYSKGAGGEFSWTPDSFVPSVRAGFYEFLLTVQKENAHVRYSTNIGMGIGNDMFGIASIWSMITGKNVNTGTGSGTVLEVKTGPMITGYTQKVLTSPNFGQQQVQALKILSATDYELKSDKETRVTPYSTETNATPVVKTVKGIVTTTTTTPTNEYTKDAIKKQVSSKGWIDAIYGWIWWIIIIIGIIIMIVIVFFMRRWIKYERALKNKKKILKKILNNQGEQK